MWRPVINHAERKCDFCLPKTCMLHAIQRQSRQHTRWNSASGEHLVPHRKASMRGEEKDRIKQRYCSGAWIVGLALALVGLLGAPGFGQTVMAC
jgi:hypothetical protein